MKKPSNCYVLVACEESQRVCIAFRNLGFNAFSCDIQSCSGGRPEWHIQQDVAPLLNGCCSFTTCDGKDHFVVNNWDLIVAHPPCTYLSKAGANRLCVRGQIVRDRYLKGIEAAKFFKMILSSECEHIVVENPIPLKIFELGPYSQIVQPYFFGDPYVKTTCLWLKNLPLLNKTNVVEPIGKWVSSTDHRVIKRNDTWQTCGVSSAKERSKTFLGIANALAAQYGSYIMVM